jgi:UDP-N-acetylmuramate--alanine ligase
MIPDLPKSKNIFLVGIGGCGVSAIGKVLHQMGYKVSGSDLKESGNTIRLKDLGVKVHIPHDANNVRDADFLVYSSAVAKDNPELAEAESRGIPIVRRAEMLSWVMNRFPHRVAVAGTHGKTTTTSMIAKLLFEGGMDPTYLVGGETDSVDGNARLGKGGWAVAEADESDGSFLELNPTISIVTNIEPDHMEYFGSIENLFKVFEEFIEKLTPDGLLVIGIDNPGCQSLLGKINRKRITYGLSPEAEVVASNLAFDGTSTRFDVHYKGKPLGEVRLTIPGEQNVVNSLAALIVGMEAGLSFGNLANVLHSFSGAKRRFQIIGEVGGVTVIDDYAHHPTEIAATLKAARLSWNGDRRIISVFQPHRFTRTFYLAEQFGTAFNDADLVILTDIYSAGETPIPGVDGKMMVDQVERHKEVLYLPRKERIPEYLLKIVKPNDVVITMGAGDINTVGRELLSRLKLKHEA